MQERPFWSNLINALRWIKIAAAQLNGAFRLNAIWAVLNTGFSADDHNMLRLCRPLGAAMLCTVEHSCGAAQAMETNGFQSAVVMLWRCVWNALKQLNNLTCLQAQYFLNILIRPHINLLRGTAFLIRFLKGQEDRAAQKKCVLK